MKYGKSNWLKKWEKMILLIKKVENRSIKKKKMWKVIPIFFFFWKTNVKEKCGCERKKVFLFF